MKTAANGLKKSIETRKLDSVMRALDGLREQLGYRLRPPYTEVIRLRADEGLQGFEIEFTAVLHLHYSSLPDPDEGLVFSVQFSGALLSDSPSPPVNELFAAGLVDSLAVYGYGGRWKGKPVSTTDELRQRLEIPSLPLSLLSIEDFLMETKD
jgi:hypothetical protein